MQNIFLTAEPLTAGQGVSVPSRPRQLSPCGVDAPALPPLLTLSGAEGAAGLTGQDENAGRLRRCPPLLLTEGRTWQSRTAINLSETNT